MDVHADTEAMLGKFVQDWNDAALRIGEELADTGPDEYYKMDPGQWLRWALAAASLQKERMAALEKEIAELKAFHYRDSASREN